jgi:nicotinamide-nucleotide amidase
MVVEIISVGTEILMGNIVNTNAAWLSEKCAGLGLSQYYQSVVGDNAKRLEGTVRLALENADIVILTGGLGPTQDDLTKETVAHVFDMELVEDEHTRKRIEEYFQNNIYKKIPENNWKQAIVPQGARVIDNQNGTAPGLILEKNGKTAILLPGPPNEMIPMFENDIVPYLKSIQPEVLYSKMIKLCGIGESQAEAEIMDLIDHQNNPTIATYAKTGEVHIRVTARAATEEEAKNLVKPIVKQIKSRFGILVYSTDEKESLEEAVVKLLRKANLTVCTAESCTGGLVSGSIVNVPGASEVFNVGYVTYSNKAKRKLLEVDKTTLKKYGAVSKQTAKEMALGAALTSGADIGLSITGVAGPDPDEDKPVGLVYIGCCHGDNVFVEEYHFKGNRQKIREQAVTKALDLLRRVALDERNN